MSFYYGCGPGGSRVLLTDRNKPVAADGCLLKSERMFAAFAAFAAML